jgi:multiple sugar transport system permease protein
VNQTSRHRRRVPVPAPFLILLVIFFGYATCAPSISASPTTTCSGRPNWVGLRNYVDLFRDALFLSALRNSILFAVIVTAVQTFLALVMAAVLNQKVRGIGFFRAAFYMPSITSSVVITLIFLWMFQRRGLINYLTRQAAARAPILLLTGVLIVVALQVAPGRLGAAALKLPATWTDPALLVVSLLVAGGATWLLVVTGVLSPREVPPSTSSGSRRARPIPPARRSGSRCRSRSPRS